MQRAQFTSTGSAIHFEWSVATNRAGRGGTPFPCDELLRFADAASSTCAWTSDRTLTANLGWGSTSLAGDVVTVTGNVTRSEGGNSSAYPPADERVSIEPPDLVCDVFQKMTHLFFYGPHPFQNKVWMRGQIDD